MIYSIFYIRYYDGYFIMPASYDECTLDTIKWEVFKHVNNFDCAIVVRV